MATDRPAPAHYRVLCPALPLGLRTTPGQSFKKSKLLLLSSRCPPVSAWLVGPSLRGASGSTGSPPQPDADPMLPHCRRVNWLGEHIRWVKGAGNF